VKTSAWATRRAYGASAIHGGPYDVLQVTVWDHP